MIFERCRNKCGRRRDKTEVKKRKEGHRRKRTKVTRKENWGALRWCERSCTTRLENNSQKNLKSGPDLPAGRLCLSLVLAFGKLR